MYVSQPVSAKNRFLAAYINGILIYFIPYLISLLLGLLTAGCMGVAVKAVLAGALYAAAAAFIYFLAVYNLMLIAVMLTGKKVTAALLGGIFFLYDIVLWIVLDDYCRLYFTTYSVMTKGPELISPLYRICMLFEKDLLEWDHQILTAAEVFNKQVVPMFPGFLVILLEAAVFGLTAYFCYKKRPMEASGKAIAFPAVKGPLKVVMIVLSGLLGSCIFCEVSGSTKPYIALPGLVIGILLCQAVLEIIYEGDFRALFAHRKSFAVGAVLVAACHLFYVFDLSGYDTWVPSAESVDSAAVEIGFNNCYRFDYIEKDYTTTWSREYELDRMEIKDVSGVLSLAADGMGKNAVERDRNKMCTCTVKYNMKNGKVKYRDFYIDYEKERRVLDILFANEDYKTGRYQVLEEWMEAVFERSEVYYENGLQDEKVPDKNALDLMLLYREDVSDMSFTDVKEELPCGILELHYTDLEKNDRYLSYPVFPSYKRTLEYLRKKNMEPYLKIDPEAVDSITVMPYNVYSYDTEADGPAGDFLFFNNAGGYIEELESVNSREYTDRAQIEEILKSVYPSSLAGWSYVSDRSGKKYKVEFTPSEQEEAYLYNWYSTDFILDGKDAPDFIAADF